MSRKQNEPAGGKAVAKSMELDPDVPAERAMLLDERRFYFLQRRAQALSESTMMPIAFAKNVSNCLLAIDIAQRMGVSELEVVQNLAVIYNRPMFSSKYLIRRINQSGSIKGRLKFIMEYDQDPMTLDYGIFIKKDKNNKDSPSVYEKRTATFINTTCVAWAIDAQDGEKLESPAVTLEMAYREGWVDRSGSKWQTMPEIMLQYRAASFWHSMYGDESSGIAIETIEAVQDAGLDEAAPARAPGAATSNFATLKERMQNNFAEEAADDAEIIDEEENSGAPAFDAVPPTDPAIMWSTFDLVIASVDKKDFEVAYDLIRDLQGAGFYGRLLQYIQCSEAGQTDEGGWNAAVSLREVLMQLRDRAKN